MGLLDADQRNSTPAVATGRLAWAGPLTVLTSIAAVHIVRQVVIRLPHVGRGSIAFGVIAVTADTAVLCTIAVVVFGLLGAFHDDAIRRFRWIAFGALLVSFLPLVAAPEIGSVATAFSVAAMHVAAYLPCVTLLPSIAGAGGHRHGQCDLTQTNGATIPGSRSRRRSQAVARQGR
jgi:hypothetical protein